MKTIIATVYTVGLWIVVLHLAVVLDAHTARIKVLEAQATERAAMMSPAEVEKDESD